MRTLPKPTEFTLEFVLIGTVRGIAKTDRCLACEQRFEDEESVFRLRDHVSLIDMLVHRRCIEFLMRSAPVDGATADREFKSYRRRLLKRYSHS